MISLENNDDTSRLGSREGLGVLQARGYLHEVSAVIRNFMCKAGVLSCWTLVSFPGVTL